MVWTGAGTVLLTADGSIWYSNTGHVHNIFEKIINSKTISYINNVGNDIYAIDTQGDTYILKDLPKHGQLEKVKDIPLCLKLSSFKPSEAISFSYYGPDDNRSMIALIRKDGRVMIQLRNSNVLTLLPRVNVFDS